ncbi:MAG: response regulator [Deltaproteobacteria bacterium]|nr:response regulator [Deltaproteobacteria bacterium]
MSNQESWLKGKKILVVDDEEDVLETVAEILEMANVEGAFDYNTASEKIALNKYDLAILDIMGVNGLTLLEEAVKNNTPTIMLTAHSMDYKTLMLSIRKGSIAFLPKEMMADLDRYVDTLMNAYDSKQSTWKILFDEMGGFFSNKFGNQMETVEWICRRID